jgi:hypothetical protein
MPTAGGMKSQDYPKNSETEALFMGAARWSDDIRTQARLQRELSVQAGA